MAERYNQAFADCKYLISPFTPDYATTNYQSYCVYINPESGVSRDSIMQYLLEKEITTRRGIMSIHREKPYRKAKGFFDLRNSEYASDNTMILPLYPQMTEEEQDMVIREIKRAFGEIRC